MKEIHKSLAEKAGVYVLTNLINGKRYIGSSKNLRERLWQHRSLLRHSKHYNQHLQNAWNKYGEDNFEYSIIEYCDENSRIEREQFYVDTLMPEYNVSTEIVNLPSYSVESRAKHSTTRKSKMASGKISITHNKPVFVYYKDGSFVGKWESIRKAAVSLHLGRNSIARVLNGTCTQNKGYKFFSNEQKSVLPFEKPTNSGKVDLRKWYVVSDGKETLEFLGLQAIANYFNTTLKSIRQYVGGKHTFKKKYMIYKKVPFYRVIYIIITPEYPRNLSRETDMAT